MFEVIAQGEGPLFMDPDADKARDFFQSKERALVNKLMPLKEAVERFVHDGAYLAIGGFGADRAPTAACQEIVRQRKKNLIFCGHFQPMIIRFLPPGKSSTAAMPPTSSGWKSAVFPRMPAAIRKVARCSFANGPITALTFGLKEPQWAFVSCPGVI